MLISHTMGVKMDILKNCEICLKDLKLRQRAGLEDFVQENVRELVKGATNLLFIISSYLMKLMNKKFFSLKKSLKSLLLKKIKTVGIGMGQNPVAMENIGFRGEVK